MSLSIHCVWHESTLGREGNAQVGCISSDRVICARHHFLPQRSKMGEAAFPPGLLGPPIRRAGQVSLFFPNGLYDNKLPAFEGQIEGRGSRSRYVMLFPATLSVPNAGAGQQEEEGLVCAGWAPSWRGKDGGVSGRWAGHHSGS